MCAAVLLDAKANPRFPKVTASASVAPKIYDAAHGTYDPCFTLVLNWAALPIKNWNG